MAAFTRNNSSSLSMLIPSLFFALLSSFNSVNGDAEANSLYLFDTIYQFGDSIADTGNLVREGPLGAATPFSRFPYGDTYFNKPTGRCSNGLLMIDFIAKELGLPHLNPYLDKEADFQHGANFAVAGSTALDTSILAQNRIMVPVTNSSLDIQVDWFTDHLKSKCSSKSECAKILKKTLFMVGEIGGNDYNYAILQGKTIDEVKADLVPKVIQTIKNAAEKLIDLGGVHLVIPGNFPIGCLPIYLTAFKSDNSSAYDKAGCLRGLNKFALFHNHHLEQMLHQLRKEHPDALIVYADYYNAFKSVLGNATLHGFDKESVLKACCGSGGDYNFDLTKLCGFDGARPRVLTQTKD
ncbi:hypothetical protein Sjap_016618 [Stephania japonica]|uniref:GDSL esterase/lipase n=1 Tax=Stephania japonica TaxID=461633 RepID=A0AAP0NV55_9MAGN